MFLFLLIGFSLSFNASLPYSYDFLQPAISEKTVHFHFDKHHLGYCTKLNELLEKDPRKEWTLERLISSEQVGTKIYNFAAQIFNHDFYWLGMRQVKKENKPKEGSKIEKLIKQSFGSFENFSKLFGDKATNHFGSGWAWLIYNKETLSLQIIDSHDAFMPKTKTIEPLLVCDVWEHAYYIDYQNARSKYVDSFFSLIDWDKVEERLPSNHTQILYL